MEWVTCPVCERKTSQLNDVKQFCLKYNLDKGFVFTPI